MNKHKLKMLRIGEYAGVHKDDPIKFYNLPFVGGLYRNRVERCINELSGGEKVLEVGFGSGVTFLNLNRMYKEIHGVDLAADVESVMGAFRKVGIRTFLKNGNILELPYPDGYFDSVLLISILEHLKPGSLIPAFKEVRRVLKARGQVVYGTPVASGIMNFGIRMLGYKAEEHHFSDQLQIGEAARALFKKVAVSNIYIWPFGKLYEIGHFTKGEA